MMTLQLRLERELHSFLPLRNDFLGDLAAAVDANPLELEIVGVRQGCVLLYVRLPDEIGAALLEAFRVRSLSGDDAFATWDVEHVREAETLDEKSVSLLRETPTDLGWLHISDLHVESQSDSDGSLDIWMEDFLRDLPDCLADAHVSPDFVIVSGDVAYSGQQGEYSRALTFFDELRDLLGRPSLRILTVPGNHDIEWDAIDIRSEMELRRKIFLNSEGTDAPTESQLEDALRAAATRQSEYRDFTVEATDRTGHPVADDYLCWITHIQLAGLDVGVVGLNSALLSTRKDLLKQSAALEHVKLPDLPIPDIDLQALALGERRLRHASDSIKDADLRIAVLHHPPFSSWYQEADLRAQRTWLPEFDFVHRGHEHVASVEMRTPIGVRSATIEAAAGALHTSPTLYMGFSAVGLSPSTRSMRFAHWAFGGSANRWHLDTIASPGGVEERVLSDRLSKRLSR